MESNTKQCNICNLHLDLSLFKNNKIGKKLKGCVNCNQKRLRSRINNQCVHKNRKTQCQKCKLMDNFCDRDTIDFPKLTEIKIESPLPPFIHRFEDEGEDKKNLFCILRTIEMKLDLILNKLH